MPVEEFVNNSTPGLSADILNEPFHIRAVVYASPNVVVTIGPGCADFSNPSGAKVARATGPSTVTITSPAVSTTYYIFLTSTIGSPNSAGVGTPTFRYATSATPQAGEARIGSVTTGNPLTNPITRTDMRGILPVPSSSLTTNVADIKPVAASAALGSSALAAPADHVHAGVVANGSVQGNFNADYVWGARVFTASTRNDAFARDGDILING